MEKNIQKKIYGEKYTEFYLKEDTQNVIQKGNCTKSYTRRNICGETYTKSHKWKVINEKKYEKIHKRKCTEKNIKNDIKKKMY